ncbi:MAG TPA: AmmeMemoRadiSam system radical SAM enzyme [Candidatus Aenigmarchaeota archaeon]|nr:MAG: AmmeMemoRadiSam system radical SAM enzyme [Candidatus Aenigmarchaeota archaeon]HDD46387.1 AmmeMemoRadiSam system radical SAM enzyme [Candidatus Aenigmarchaeota archaeon]
MLTLPSSPPKEKSLSLWKWSKEAYHYIRLGNNVQCLLCPNQCILEHGERGRCRVRINNNGKLYTLVYGNPTAVHVDPIEKKPLFHFLPSTKAFSIATAGCNFRCLNCQNWQISQFPPEKTENYDMMPKVVVNNAITESCSSIAYTYNEPSVFYEYMYDTAKLAKEHKLRNLWITNGYMNEKPLRELCKYLDAANVDLKSFSEKIYNELNAGRLEPVLNTLKVLKSEGVWFEITNLVVPTYTDDIDMIRDMVEWIAKNLGKDYPLHFSRFFPHYKLTHLPPTPIDFLEQARKIAMDAGLKFVYIGNVPNHKAQNTYCPRCGRLLVERRGYYVASMNIENNACKFCGEHIAGVWS